MPRVRGEYMALIMNRKLSHKSRKELRPKYSSKKRKREYWTKSQKTLHLRNYFDRGKIRRLKKSLIKSH
jgi:hypothetical protein